MADFLTTLQSIGGCTHYWPLTVDADDMVGSLHGTATGTTSYNTTGALFTGTNYIQVPDSSDLSLASQTAGLTIIAFMQVSDWTQGTRGDSNGYVHWMGKAAGTANEYKFRHYFFPDTSGESPPRDKRTSFYHFNAAGGLGAGSYFQDDDPINTERFVVGRLNRSPGETSIFKNGVLRDTDPFSDYSIVPTNTSTPFRIGTSDLNSFFKGRIRQVAVFNKELTQTQINTLYAARNDAAFPVTAAPTTHATQFGACPTNPGGTSLTAAQTVVTKFGTKSSVRIFKGSDLTDLPTHPTNASVVHTSWKPDITAVNAGSLDGQINALIDATPNGDIIEFNHEPDNDGLTSAGITAMISAKNRLYTMAKSRKPGVLVCHTFTGGFWASYGNDATRDVWMNTAKGHLLGLDADGVHDDTGPTYDTSYQDEVDNLKRYLSAKAVNGWIGWTVPEFGTSRQPWDTTGTPRANWFQAQSQIFINNNAYACMLFDYNTTAHDLVNDYNTVKTSTPEMSVWTTLVAENVTPPPVLVAPSVPAGSFSWKGLNWHETDGGTGSPGVGGWSAANVDAPNSAGYVVMRLTNPTGNAPIGCAIDTKVGGYGTYMTTVDGQWSTFGKQAVFGGMFTYHEPVPGSHNEIDVCETSAWGENINPGIAHTWWATDATSRAGTFFVPPNGVQTHYLIWEPGKLTFRSYNGTGYTGTLLMETITTTNVPTPAGESLIFNLWAGTFNGVNGLTVPGATVTLRDFSYSSSRVAPWLGGGTGTTNQKIATLYDTFDTRDTAKWTWGSSATVVSGQARFSPTGYDTNAMITSTGTYDLTSSVIDFDLPAIPATIGGDGPLFDYILTANPDLFANPARLVFRYEPLTATTGNLIPRYYAAGAVPTAPTTVGTTVPWAATTRFRISHDGTNVLWGTNANGAGWVTRLSVPTPIPITGLKVIVRSSNDVPNSGYYAVSSINPASVPAAPPAVSTPVPIQDSFATKDTAKWTWGAGAVQQTANSGEILLSANGYGNTARIRSVNAINLTDNYVYMDLAGGPTRNAASVDGLFLAFEMNSGTTYDDGNVLDWLIDRSSSTLIDITPRYRIGTAGVRSSGTSLAYDPVAHKYLRIRHASGNVLWETSPNATTWTTQRTVAAPFAVTALRVGLYTGSDVTNTGSFTIRSINGEVAPATGPTITVPTAPTNLVVTPGSTQLSLSWTPPVDNGGAEVLDYTVTYTAVAPPVTTGVPSAPPATTANVTSVSADLNWTAPVDGGSPITGYRAFAFNSAGTSAATFNPEYSIDLPSTARTYNFTNFVSGSTYRLQVLALNAIGAGPRSTAINVTATTGPVTPPPTPTGSGMPTRVVSAYWPTWQSTRLTALPSGTTGYNVIFLAFATGSHLESGTGAVTYSPGPGVATTKADIASLRAKGVKIMLSVGGSGSYPYLNTTSRRDAFYNSIVAIYEGTNGVGPFDGLDWNFETNYLYAGTIYNKSVTGQVLTNILWICSSLKNRYPGFMISKPPSPDSTHDRNWINAMNNQGTFDLVMPQYYDGGGGSFPSNISFWTSSLGVGTPSKVAPGIIDNERYAQYGSGTGTQSSINTRWDQAKVTYPGLRGAMYWHTGIDALSPTPYWFANTFGARVRAS